MSVKIERIENNIIEQVSYIIATEIKNKNISFVTITACKLTNDLSFAKLYFTVLDDTHKQLTTTALNSASKFIRRQLADRIDIRHIPELSFIYDESIAYGQKIETIVKNMKE